jgi:hypothetical protein
MPPVTARRRLVESQPSPSSFGIQPVGATGNNLIAADHVTAGNTGGATSRDASLNLADLPANVFQTPAISRKPVVVPAFDLGAQILMAACFHAFTAHSQTSPGARVCIVSTRAQNTIPDRTAQSQNPSTPSNLTVNRIDLVYPMLWQGPPFLPLDRPIVASHEPGAKTSGSGNGSSHDRDMATSGRVDGGDSSGARRPAPNDHLLVDRPTDGVTFGRSDDLDAWLVADLIQSAQRLAVENKEAGPACTLSAGCTELASGKGAGPGVAASDSIGFDWADFVPGLSPEPLKSDLAIADAGDKGTQAAFIDPDDVADQSDSSSSISSPISWSEAMAYSRQVSKPADEPAVPDQSIEPLSHTQPEVLADLKQAVLLTRDAFNAWMNFARRSPAFKITKR